MPGNVKDVEAVLAKAVSVELQDAHGDRALHVAAKGGHLEVVTLLKAKGADLNSKGSYGNTALIKASYWGKFEVVKVGCFMLVRVGLLLPLSIINHTFLLPSLLYKASSSYC